MIVRSAGVLTALLFVAFSVDGCVKGLEEMSADQGAGTEVSQGSGVQSIKSSASVGETHGGMTKTGDFYRGSVIASDPSIIEMGDAFRMFYTDLNVRQSRTVIATATSNDGITWTTQGSGRGVSGIALDGRDGKWDENIESASVVRAGGEWWLYYSGYRDKGDPFKGFPAAMGLAKSSDGQNYTRISDGPILEPTRGWYDNDAIYSATVHYENGTFYMVYVGHAYTDTSKIGAGGVYLLGATSKDGVNWTKQPNPIARPGQFADWRADGLAEPYLVKRGASDYLLFFTGLRGDDRKLGVGTGSSPVGPFTFNAKPILLPGPKGTPDESLVLAPAAVLDNDKMRMWYLASNRKELLTIGHAEGSVSEVLRLSR